MVVAKRAVALLGGAIAVAGCSSSGTWKPVPATILPAAPGVEMHHPPKHPTKAHAEAKPPAPTPMPADLPNDVDGALGASATCEKTCTVAGVAPKGVAVPPKSPAVTWSESFPNAKAKLTFARDPRIDVYGVVVKGEAKVRATEEGAGKTLGPWTAFHAPAAGIDLESTKPGTRVVLAVVSDGTALDALPAPPKKATKRPSPVETKSLAEAPDLPWAGGAYHVRLAFEGKPERASLDVLLASPDAPVAPHVHEGSWEVLAMLRADGSFASAPDKDARELTGKKEKDGDVAIVPPGTKHAWLPGGTKPLVGIQLYVPPGPEQRFKQLAGK